MKYSAKVAADLKAALDSIPPDHREYAGLCAAVKRHLRSVYGWSEDVSFPPNYVHVLQCQVGMDIRQSILHATQLKENTMGLQGYSTPTPHTVVFSTNYPDILAAIKDAGLAEHIMEGRGRYRGKEEVSYCCDKPVYDELIRRWPWLVAEQESILLLGTPKHCNWRPATLKYINGNLRGMTEDIGMWIEVSTEELLDSNVDYSLFGGRAFVVKKNPPIDREEEEHREYTELLKRAFVSYIPGTMIATLLAQRAAMLGRRDKEGRIAVEHGGLHYAWVYK